MSRSYKKYAIYKDKGGYNTYNRIIRSRIKNFIRTYFYQLSDIDFDKSIPKEKEIIDDYDVCDWVYKPEFWHWKIDPEEIKKLKTK